MLGYAVVIGELVVHASVIKEVGSKYSARTTKRDATKVSRRGELERRREI